MDYLQTTGDRLHDLELDRILARLRTLEGVAGATAVAAPTAVTLPASPVISAGVRSVTPGSNGTQIYNDVTLAVAGPLSIAQAGQTITLTATAAPATTVTEVAAGAVAGTSALYARADHTHRGVHKVTGSADAFGDLVFTGSGVAQSGNTFTFSGSSSGSSAPANVLVISPGPTAFSWAVPAALTEFNASVLYRAQHDLTNATQARLLLFLPSPNIVPPAIPVLAAQYSTNGGTAWSYLDGSTGPALTYGAGVVSSGWISLTAGAKADVLLRVVAAGGNGSTSLVFGAIYLQVK